jgi:hypothetical protein
MAPLISNFKLSVPALPVYHHQDGATHTVIPITTSFTMGNIPESARKIYVPTETLPFGLTNGIAITGCGLTPYKIKLTKSSGPRETEWLSHGNIISLVGINIGCDADAYDPQLDTVKNATLHDFKFRMIAAQTLTHLVIEFNDVPPSEVVIVFHGVNAIPVEVTISQATATLLEHKLPPFLLKPIKRAPLT